MMGKIKDFDGEGLLSRKLMSGGCRDIIPPIVTNYKISFLFCTDLFDMNTLAIKIISSACSKKELFGYKPKIKSECLVVGDFCINSFKKAEFGQSIKGNSISRYDNLTFLHDLSMWEISTNYNGCSDEIISFISGGLILFLFGIPINEYSRDCEENFVSRVLEIKRITRANVAVISPIYEFSDWDRSGDFLQQYSRPLLVVDKGSINCIYSPGNYPFIDKINMEVN